MTAQVAYQRGTRRRSPAWMLRSAVRRFGWAAVGTLDRLVPKRRRRVVLGSDKGLKYSGNPRYLFEYLAAQDGWDAYWLTESRDIRREINARFPGKALSAWSLRALAMGLSARWLAFSHSKYDLGPFAYLRRPRFIYLNHGVPLKTMGFAKAYDDPFVANAAATIGAVTCCSELEGTLWQRAYGVPADRMWVTGVPRNDRLFDGDRSVLDRLGIASGRRVVLYAPTYRETGALPDYLPVPGLDGAALVTLLERHDAVMLVRPHYYEWQAARQTVERLGSERFRTADEREVADVNELLPAVDVLVTDYSSIYFDYLLLDRPIVFACHDRAAYERERGFMIDYDANTPGYKAATPEEFLAALDAALGGDDRHAGFRREVRDRFHRFADGHSAERIAARIAEGR